MYDFEITDEQGQTVGRGQCSGHTADDARTVLLWICDTIADLSFDRQEHGCWCYDAATDTGNYSITFI